MCSCVSVCVCVLRGGDDWAIQMTLETIPGIIGKKEGLCFMSGTAPSATVTRGRHISAAIHYLDYLLDSLKKLLIFCSLHRFGSCFKIQL